MGMATDSEPPLGIPSFLWGCILGVVGILLVYILTDGDKAETKKALWGMLVWIGVWVVLYVGVFSASALWY
jgi:cytochrome c biogenesis protein CcdA